MVMVPLNLSHCGRYERDEPGAVTKGTVQFRHSQSGLRGRSVDAGKLAAAPEETVDSERITHTDNDQLMLPPLAGKLPTLLKRVVAPNFIATTDAVIYRAFQYCAQ